MRRQFLAAVSEDQRPQVTALLNEPRRGGVGLRMWLRSLVDSRSPLPESLPKELVQVYLDDSEAMPYHECAVCGVSMPVRNDRSDDGSAPEHVYFSNCPICQGSTGLHAGTVRQGDSDMEIRFTPVTSGLYPAISGDKHEPMVLVTVATASP